MPGVSIQIAILEDGIEIQHFQRFAKPTAEGVRRVCEEATGWLQAYSGAVNEDQWRNDVERARQGLSPQLMALP